MFVSCLALSSSTTKQKTKNISTHHDNDDDWKKVTFRGGLSDEWIEKSVNQHGNAPPNVTSWKHPINIISKMPMRLINEHLASFIFFILSMVDLLNFNIWDYFSFKCNDVMVHRMKIHPYRSDTLSRSTLIFISNIHAEQKKNRRNLLNNVVSFRCSLLFGYSFDLSETSNDPFVYNFSFLSSKSHSFFLFWFVYTRHLLLRNRTRQISA